MFEKNTLVCIYLQNPHEKFWGRLYQHDVLGIHFVGIEIQSFKDWCRELSTPQEAAIFPTNLFIPTWRIEKIVLDESQGVFQSFADQFLVETGLNIADYLPPV